MSDVRRGIGVYGGNGLDELTVAVAPPTPPASSTPSLRRHCLLRVLLFKLFLIVVASMSRQAFVVKIASYE